MSQIDHLFTERETLVERIKQIDNHLFGLGPALSLSGELQRLAMFRELLIGIAPIYARWALRKLNQGAGDVYAPQSLEQAYVEQRRKVAAEAAELAAQLALHLAAKYADFCETIHASVEAKNAAQKAQRP